MPFLVGGAHLAALLPLWGQFACSWSAAHVVTPARQARSHRFDACHAAAHKRTAQARLPPSILPCWLVCVQVEDRQAAAGSMGYLDMMQQVTRVRFAGDALSRDA